MGEYETTPTTVSPAQATKPAAQQPKPRHVGPHAGNGHKRVDVHTAKDSAIEKHLDAAIVAARTGLEQNAVGYLDEMVLHAKAATALLEGHARVEGQLEPRVKQLIECVDAILDEEPWTQRRLGAAIDPLRNVK